MPPKTNTKAHRNIALYPQSHHFRSLSQFALLLKIARHSPCSACDDCAGLIPDDNVIAVLDSEWNDDASGPANYIAMCRCGHQVHEHGVSQGITQEEFNRRGRVAIRLDEILEVRMLFAR